MRGRKWGRKAKKEGYSTKAKVLQLDTISPALVSTQTCPSTCIYRPVCSFAAQHTARLKQQEASTLSCGAQPKVEQDHNVCVCVCWRACAWVCVCMRVKPRLFPPWDLHKHASHLSFEFHIQRFHSFSCQSFFQPIKALHSQSVYRSRVV